MGLLPLYPWVTEVIVITLLIEVISLFITGRGPLCRNHEKRNQFLELLEVVFFLSGRWWSMVRMFFMSLKVSIFRGNGA